MLRPSGDALMTTTSAPAARRAAGPTSLAAPLAQSTAMRRPASGCAEPLAPIEPTRCSTYESPALPVSDWMWPTAAPRGRSQASLRRLSIASSTASGSLTPPRAKNLMPLSGMALCEADRTTPRSTSAVAVRYAIAGVGRTPRLSTSTPALARPAATAAERNSPETRGSRPTTARGRCPSNVPEVPSTCAAATPRSSASSAVTSRLARPRTPSVPKSRVTGVPFADTARRQARLVRDDSSVRPRARPGPGRAVHG